MAYAYGMRFDDDSNAITVIDEDNQTAVTTGYIDGEYVEFGGGNPNHVQTITGTVTNPWGDLDPDDLRTRILLDGATALMTITIGEQVGQAYLMAGNDGFIVSSATDGGNSGFLTLRVTWRLGELVHFWTMQGANGAYQYRDLVSMASQCPTTLKIIWHPLPEE